MPSYTVTTDTQAEAALSAIVAKRNAERAALDPPQSPLTNAQYVAAIWAGVLASYVKEAEADEDAKLREAFRDPARRAAIRTAARI